MISSLKGPVDSIPHFRDGRGGIYRGVDSGHVMSDFYYLPTLPYTFGVTSGDYYPQEDRLIEKGKTFPTGLTRSSTLSTDLKVIENRPK